MRTSQHLPRAALSGGAVALALMLSGCGPATDGEPATWELVDPDQVTAASTTLEIEVTRLACASGRTGEVLDPVVAYEEQRVVITVDVAPLDGDAYTCQGNDAVPLTVTLEEAVGERDLVDGACLDGEAVSTSFCVTEIRRPAG